MAIVVNPNSLAGQIGAANNANQATGNATSTGASPNQTAGAASIKPVDPITGTATVASDADKLYYPPAATVATPKNPLISKPLTPPAPSTYTPAVYSDLDSLNNDQLQQYVDSQQNYVNTGKTLSLDDQNKLSYAGRLLQKNANNPADITTPYNTAIDTAQGKEDAAKTASDAANTSEFAQFKQGQDATLANNIADTTAAGKKEATAAQAGLSFSGFGRSTLAASRQADIQKETNNSITALQGAEQATLQAEQLREQGVSDKELQPYIDQVNALTTAATKAQSDQIEKMNEFNQANVKTYSDKIDNIEKLAQASGGTQYADATPEQQTLIDSVAKLAIDPKTGVVNSDVLKNVPPSLLSATLIKAAEVAKGVDDTLNPDKYTLSAPTKESPGYVFDSTTGVYKELNPGNGGTDGGSGSGGGSGGASTSTFNPSFGPLYTKFLQDGTTPPAAVLSQAGGAKAFADQANLYNLSQTNGILNSKDQARVTSIQKAFQGSQYNKNFQAATDSVNQARSIPIDNNNPNEDVNLIHAFIKVMDPNAVVRGSTFDRYFNENSSLANTANVWLQRIADNGTADLTPKSRQNLKDAIDNAYKAIKTDYDSAAKVQSDQIQAISNQATGPNSSVNSNDPDSTNGDVQPGGSSDDPLGISDLLKQ